jgi:hypothetical protein
MRRFEGFPESVYKTGLTEAEAYKEVMKEIQGFLMNDCSGLGFECWVEEEGSENKDTVPTL